MTDQRIDFLNKPFRNFLEQIYIPSGCSFEVESSVNAENLTTITTKSEHCLKNNDSILICLKEEDCCAAESYSQLWPVTVIDSKVFTIPLDSENCASFTGKGHKPKDLTGAIFTGSIFNQPDAYLTGSTASGTSGSNVVVLTVNNSAKNTKIDGGQITVGGSTYRILGSAIVDQGCSTCENDIDAQIAVTLDSNLTSDISGAWSIAYILDNDARPWSIAENLAVAKDDSLGQISVTFDNSGLEEEREYFYEIYENVGAAISRVFSGRLTFGLPENAEGCGFTSCPTPVPVVVADPEAINNVEINVSSIAALEALTGLSDYTVRRPLGFYSAGDRDMPSYTLVPQGGLTVNGSTVRTSAIPGKVWTINESDHFNPMWSGANGDGATNDSTFFTTAETSGLDLLITEDHLLEAVTLTSPLVFSGGKLITAETLTLNGLYSSKAITQIFEQQGSGVVLSAQGQELRPEYFGDSTENIQQAIDSAYGGSIIRLQGKTYESSGISLYADPTIDRGGHTGLTLQGSGMAQRYKNSTGANKFFGTVIEAAQGIAVDELISMNAISSFSWGQQTVKDLTIDCLNRCLYGINIKTIRDPALHNLHVLNASQDGIALTGNNNQSLLSGRIEVYNCGRDGISAQAAGDAQWQGEIRTVNNDRFGIFLGTGSLKANHMYSYFNRVGLRIDSDDFIHINHLRLEDNDEQGLLYAGKSTAVDYCSAADNGADASTDITRSGVYNNGSGLHIQTLINPFRDIGGIPHNQKIVYSEGASAIGASIGTIDNEAYGLHSLTGEKTVLLASTGLPSRQTRVTHRRTYINPLSLVGQSLNRPDTYGIVSLTDCNSNFTVANTDSLSSIQDSEWILQFAATANIDITFGTAYKDPDGVDLGTIAVTSGQTLYCALVRRRFRWVATVLTVG